MFKLALSFAFFIFVTGTSFAKNCPAGKKIKYFDMYSGDEIKLTLEEEKKGQKRTEKIDYIKFKFNNSDFRLSSDRVLTDEKGKRYESFRELKYFNWLNVYKYKNGLLLRIGFSDGVDINSSVLFLLDSKTFNKISRFDIPCMHNNEKIFIHSKKLTYACQHQVEEKKGKIFYYSDVRKKWLESNGMENWAYYGKFKELTHLKVETVKKFDKWVNLSNFDQYCRH